jgi:dihydroxyacid dehydratase/phosphogluconate dehydratase
LGGSTNAVIHLIAIAGRRNIDLSLDRFDELAQTTPFLANMSPSGKHLMDAFFAAGGLPALLAEIRDLLHVDCLTVTGRTIGESLENARSFDRDVIRPRTDPLLAGGSLAVVRGNLAPCGAVIKTSAATPALLKHQGRAVVFENYEDMLARINDPALPVDRESVLVLRNAGPKGVPGFPEWGMIPVPTKLLQQGVTDMVRISDSRMSGTSYGTVVIHISPEAAAGGPLALVQSGDFIELDVPQRRLDLLIDSDKLERRRQSWRPPASPHRRGFPRLYIDHVLQAHDGADFDFLRPRSDEDLDFLEPTVGRS